MNVEISRLGPSAQKQLAEKLARQNRNARQNRSKYHAEKETRTINGQKVKFDSRKEASRWDELCLMERAGKIYGLCCQPVFELIPAQKINGAVVERPVKYRADFLYFDTKTGEKVIEDVKGVRTEAYIIKRKLMLFLHGERVKEV